MRRALARAGRSGLGAGPSSPRPPGTLPGQGRSGDRGLSLLPGDRLCYDLLASTLRAEVPLSLWRCRGARASAGCLPSAALSACAHGGADSRSRPRSPPRAAGGRPTGAEDPIAGSSPRPTPTSPRASTEAKEGHLNRRPRGVRPRGRRLPDGARRRLRQPAAGRGLPPHARRGPGRARSRPSPPGDGFTETPAEPASIDEVGDLPVAEEPASDETRRTAAGGGARPRPTTSPSS